MAETETVTLNLDGTFATAADKAAAAGTKLGKALDDLNNELDKSSKGATEHGEKIQKIKDPADIARHALEGVSNGLKGMASAIRGGDAKGAIDGLTESLASAATLLDLIVPGLGQVAAAIIKVGGAFAGVTVGVAQAGVELALEVTAMNASLEATFQALGKGPDAGKKTIEMLDDVARTLPQSREELAKWTREIQKMGVTDLSAIRSELLATASAQAILGEGGDAAYGKISRKVHDAIDGHHKLTITSKELTRTIGTNLADAIAKKMGLSLEVLEQKLKAGTVDAQKFGNAMEETFIEKGGGGLDAMWMKTGKITAKLKESFGELFKDVDTAPITDAMRNLLALFDQTEPSGEGMKATFTDVFNSLVKGIGWAITEGEVLFLEMEVWALSAQLALKPVWNVVKAIGEALQKAGEGLGLVAPPGAPPAAPKSAGEMAGNALADIADPVGAILKRLGPTVQGPSNDVGTAVGQGLIGGMLAQLGLVDMAGQQLGEAAVKGAKTGAGAHSPSLPAIRIGGYLSEGLALGMQNTIDLPERAGRQIGGAALGGMAQQALASGPANQNGGGGGISIASLVLHIAAPQGVTDATAVSASALVIAVERLQLASGR